jgi:hypothetical protein
VKKRSTTAGASGSAPAVAELLALAAKNPAIAHELCDAIAVSATLRPMMSKALRLSGEGKRRGRASDEIDKLASFMAYSEFSIRTTGPLVKRGFQVGDGRIAELLARTQGITVARFNNKIHEAKRLWQQLQSMPTGPMMERVRAAHELSLQMQEDALTALDSRNNAKRE